MVKFRLALTSVLVLAGCAGPSGTTAPPTGAVHGTIVQVGGPAGAAPGHPAGTVTVTRDGQRVARVRVAEGGGYRFTLPAGTYRLTVAGVDGGCAPADVTVPADADQAIDLTCQRK